MPWSIWGQQYQDQGIYARRFSAGAWGPVTLLGTGKDGICSPHVAMDNSGQIMVVWYASQNIYTKRFSSGSWGATIGAGDDPWPTQCITGRDGRQWQRHSDIQRLRSGQRPRSYLRLSILPRRLGNINPDQQHGGEVAELSMWPLIITATPWRSGSRAMGTF